MSARKSTGLRRGRSAQQDNEQLAEQAPAEETQVTPVPSRRRGSTAQLPPAPALEQDLPPTETADFLPFEDVVPALGAPSVFDFPSPRLQALFPHGAPLFNWPLGIPKSRVPGLPCDIVAVSLRNSGAPNSHVWLREWNSIQPAVSVAIVAAEASDQIAEELANRPDLPRGLQASIDQLSTLLFAQLDRLLQRATVIVAASQDPALAARVDTHFGSETLGIHPGAHQLFREFRPQHHPQRPPYWRRPTDQQHQQQPPRPQGRGRGRGVKPRSGPASTVSE
eukprot:m.727775 g.727775  ORF g.727775 m.727775 type:complete len:280 (-) comp58864_c5_seq15:987-1826(-)